MMFKDSYMVRPRCKRKIEIAIRLGNDVDMQRNLAKSVTVE